VGADGEIHCGDWVLSRPIPVWSYIGFKSFLIPLPLPLFIPFY